MLPESRGVMKSPVVQSVGNKISVFINESLKRDYGRGT